MIWYVAIGSAIGGAARLVLGALVQQRSGASFPVGTLVVNVTGCFLVGVFARYMLATEAFSPNVRAMLTTGFCGGFTTFSTFSYETLLLMESGQVGRGVSYVAASVGLSLAATALGFSAARALAAARL